MTKTVCDEATRQRKRQAARVRARVQSARFALPRRTKRAIARAVAAREWRGAVVEVSAFKPSKRISKPAIVCPAGTSETPARLLGMPFTRRGGAK